MGRIKYLTQVRAFCQKTPLVTLASIKKMLGIKSHYAHLLLHNLVKRGELKRITRGNYSTHDDPLLVAFCLKPAYLGLQEALSIHHLWEQETNVILLTPRKIRTGMRTVFGSHVLIRRIKPAHFFGFEYRKYGNWHIPVSDPEKTFIDLAYFNQPLETRLLRTFRKKLNRDKLRKYLAQYPARTAQKIRKLL
jgi:predicted transcriptional regulator of viral defense system